MLKLVLKNNELENSSKLREIIRTKNNERHGMHGINEIIKQNENINISNFPYNYVIQQFYLAVWSKDQIQKVKRQIYPKLVMEFFFSKKYGLCNN